MYTVISRQHSTVSEACTLKDNTVCTFLCTAVSNILDTTHYFVGLVQREGTAKVGPHGGAEEVGMPQLTQFGVQTKQLGSSLEKNKTTALTMTKRKHIQCTCIIHHLKGLSLSSQKIIKLM